MNSTDNYFDAEKLFRRYFISRAKDYLRSMTDEKYWLGVKSDIDKWVKNFDGIREGEYIAMRIICNMIVYSETDVAKLVDAGLRELYKENLVKCQIDNDFRLRVQECEHIVKEIHTKTILCPLEVDAAPTQSSHALLRVMKNRSKRADECKVYSLSEIESIQKGSVGQLVVVDDWIGSGKQVETFMKRKVGNNDNIVEFCKEKNIQLIFLFLAGYKKSIEEIEKKGIKVICMESIDDSHSLFKNGSSCWKNEEERVNIKSILDAYSNRRGIKIYG